MAERYKVALLINPDATYTRSLLRGIRAYIREHQPWSIYHGEYSGGETSPAGLPKWKGDGIIARVENQTIAQAVARSELPLVDVSAARLVPSCPSVHSDDQTVGRLAADHLLKCEFKHFAFCGDEQMKWSELRLESFRRLIIEFGDCSVAHPTRKSSACDFNGSRSCWPKRTSRCR